MGAALGVVQYFAENHLKAPTRLYGGSGAGQLTWRPLDHGRVLAILHNPSYAGTYVYGRTKTRSVLLPHEEPRVKGRTRRIAVEDWPFVLHDHHPAYITWEQFRRNQLRLIENCTSQHQEHRGAIREGAALLQGLVLCGRCGRRMTVRYMDDGKIPLYECNQLHKNLGEKTCQSLRGDGIDAAVARAFLEAMRPAQLEVSMAAIDQIAEQARRVDRQWGLIVERHTTRRSWPGADSWRSTRRTAWSGGPWSGIGKRSWPRWSDWSGNRPPGPRSRSAWWTRGACRILALAQDLPAVWHAETTTNADRKQLIGFLIKDVSLTRAETTIEVSIRWQTEACTVLCVPRPRRSCDVRRTDPVVIARFAPWRPTPPIGGSPRSSIRRGSARVPGIGSRRHRKTTKI